MRHGVEQHAGHVFDSLDIAGHLVLERPHLGRRVVRNRQMLQPGAERRAQIAFNVPARHTHQMHVINVGRDILDDHHETDSQNLIQSCIDLIRRQPRFGNHVDHLGRQNRQHENRRRLDHVHDPDEDEPPFVFGVKSQIILKRATIAVFAMQ